MFSPRCYAAIYLQDGNIIKTTLMRKQKQLIIESHPLPIKNIEPRFLTTYYYSLVICLAAEYIAYKTFYLPKSINNKIINAYIEMNKAEVFDHAFNDIVFDYYKIFNPKLDRLEVHLFYFYKSLLEEKYQTVFSKNKIDSIIEIEYQSLFRLTTIINKDNVVMLMLYQNNNRLILMICDQYHCFILKNYFLHDDSLIENYIHQILAEHETNLWQHPIKKIIYQGISEQIVRQSNSSNNAEIISFIDALSESLNFNFNNINLIGLGSLLRVAKCI